MYCLPVLQALNANSASIQYLNLNHNYTYNPKQITYSTLTSIITIHITQNKLNISINEPSEEDKFAPKLRHLTLQFRDKQ
jgi:hypothetical protein